WWVPGHLKAAAWGQLCVELLSFSCALRSSSSVTLLCFQHHLDHPYQRVCVSVCVCVCVCVCKLVSECDHNRHTLFKPSNQGVNSPVQCIRHVCLSPLS